MSSYTDGIFILSLRHFAYAASLTCEVTNYLADRNFILSSVCRIYLKNRFCTIS